MVELVEVGVDATCFLVGTLQAGITVSPVVQSIAFVVQLVRGYGSKDCSMRQLEKQTLINN